jgi:hypothetical protein
MWSFRLNGKLVASERALSRQLSALSTIRLTLSAAARSSAVIVPASGRQSLAVCGLQGGFVATSLRHGGACGTVLKAPREGALAA